jgi:hypothetical protein
MRITRPIFTHQYLFEKYDQPRFLARARSARWSAKKEKEKYLTSIFPSRQAIILLMFKQM